MLIVILRILVLVIKSAAFPNRSTWTSIIHHKRPLVCTRYQSAGQTSSLRFITRASREPRATEIWSIEQQLVILIRFKPQHVLPHCSPCLRKITPHYVFRVNIRARWFVHVEGRACPRVPDVTLPDKWSPDVCEAYLWHWAILALAATSSPTGSCDRTPDTETSPPKEVWTARA